MSHNANVSTKTYKEKTVIAAGGHPVVSRTGKLKAAQGVLEMGQVLAEDANEDLVPYADGTVSIGTGDGVNKDFSGTLPKVTADTASVSVTDGTQTVTDDGHGNFIGDGTGTVNYKTGAVSVSFTAASANAADISASGWNVPSGVLERRVDTATADDGQVIEHGSVVASALLVKTAAPTAAMLKRLARAGIYGE